MTRPEGAVPGAVYNPAEVIVPTDESPPRTPETNQFTELLLAPETVALKGCDCPTCILTLVGEIDTDTAAGVTETVALAEAEFCAPL